MALYRLLLGETTVGLKGDEMIDYEAMILDRQEAETHSDLVYLYPDDDDDEEED